MDHRLAHLISKYQKAVKSAVTLLEDSGIQLPDSNVEWACADIPHKGVLIGAISYFKHGYGCVVYLPTGTVDFDFGKSGEINGFDLWRLTCFVEDNYADYGFENEKELKVCFEQAKKAGAFIYSGYTLFYLADPAV
jgi:hypothetical protein